MNNTAAIRNLRTNFQSVEHRVDPLESLFKSCAQVIAFMDDLGSKSRCDLEGHVLQFESGKSHAQTCIECHCSLNNKSKIRKETARREAFIAGKWINQTGRII